jgi:hypothetical protein
VLDEAVSSLEQPGTSHTDLVDQPAARRDRIRGVRQRDREVRPGYRRSPSRFTVRWTFRQALG